MTTHQYEIETRVLEEAEWYLDHRKSIRDVAENFMVSKSTVYVDLTIRLKNLNQDMYGEVICLLHYNKVHAIEKMNKSNELRRYYRR